ncbi:MAG: restriction endonuclease, partial [Candidatus Omnitrophica bacterium]|nr:restriction endonuclease [Candidatus Omnitrophota bacterium]
MTVFSCCDALMSGRVRFAVGWCAAGVWLASAAHGFCAETVDPTATSTTVMILRLDSTTPVEIRTRFLEPPPTITIEFPRQRVMGSLPERSTLQAGAIRSILTQYHSGTELQPSRVIRSLQIILSAHYAYRVRSEPGRIIVAIDHPSSVGSRTMEVALKGGTIIGALGPRPVSERFHAMQRALDNAVPDRAVPSRTTANAQRPATPAAAGSSPAAPARSGRSSRSSDHPIWWTVAMAALAAGVLWRVRASRRGPPLVAGGRLPSGVTLIDGLIWPACERQGYQLIKAVERAQPSVPLRMITKDGSKAVLGFVWNGSFFEKRTVEQFAAACREVGVDQGFLVASGSFTVPAQRVAKDHNITLVGREQLMELLSTGATSEYFTKQVEQL